MPDPDADADQILLLSLPGFPLVRPNDDLAALVITAMEQSRMYPADGNVLVLAQKIVSKAEGRYLDLAEVEPSQRAQDIAAQVKKDARFVEAVLRESRRVVRHAPNVLIVEHQLGLVMANAGIDRSNIEPGMGTEPVLLLPADPDASAARMLKRLTDRFGRKMAVIVSDSFGRPWRRGTVGVALGAPPLVSPMDTPPRRALRLA